MEQAKMYFKAKRINDKSRELMQRGINDTD